MARGVNKVILIGHLGKDPELRNFNNGGCVANTSLATTQTWKDKDSGETKEHTEWHNLVFSNKLAEIAAKYLKKGSPVYVEGSLRTRKYEKNGEDRYITEIAVREMQMLGSKRDDDGGSGAPSSSSRTNAYAEAKYRTPPKDCPQADQFDYGSIPF